MYKPEYPLTSALCILGNLRGVVTWLLCVLDSPRVSQSPLFCSRNSLMSFSLKGQFQQVTLPDYRRDIPLSVWSEQGYVFTLVCVYRAFCVRAPYCVAWICMVMAVVGSRHARHIMAFQGAPPPAPSQHAILTAAVAVPFFQVAPPQDVQPDRPIGYGAFGVVWWVCSHSAFVIMLTVTSLGHGFHEFFMNMSMTKY